MWPVSVVGPRTSHAYIIIQLITLSETEMNEIDALHKKPGMHRSLLGFHAADGSVFGWSYEKLGWKMKVGGVVDDRA